MSKRLSHLDWQIHDGAGRRKYLNAEERQRFLAVADGLSPSRRALCHVLAYTGCSVSEALALTRQQLDMGSCLITSPTLKRRRASFRTMPVPSELAVMLLTLSTSDTSQLWTMHRATAWRVVKGVMECVGIRGPMASPKGLRHGFGVRAAGRDVPVNLIQRWMGHASPNTTAIYLNVVSAEEHQFASRMW